MLGSIRPAIILTFGLLAGHAPALAQSGNIDRHFSNCGGFTANDPGQRLLSCTWLLDNGGLDPKTRAVVHLSRAISYMGKREVERAHADFDSALALDRELIGAYGLKDSLLREYGRFADALAVATKWVSVAPSAIAFERRGINRVLTGDLAGGESDYLASMSRAETEEDKVSTSRRVCGYLATTLAAMGRTHAEAPSDFCADMQARSDTLPSAERALSEDTFALARFAWTGGNTDDAEVLTLLADARRRDPEMPAPEIRMLEFERMIRQRSMQLLGFWPGETDGKASPETRAAVADFQRRNDLTASGDFDTATVDAMTKMIAEKFPK